MPTTSITPKQQTILLLLHRFRFLNRPQIQRFFNHKDYETTNTWLRDLTEKNYLGRIYSASFPDNTKPAVYYLAVNGIRWLKKEGSVEASSLRKLYRESERSTTFIDRCILLATLYLDLSKRSTQEVTYVMSVVSDYPALPEAGLITNLSPDAYLVKKHKGQIQHFFIEILEDIPLAKLRQRIKRYVSCYESDEWLGEVFPTILIACPNKRVLAYISRYTKKLLKEHDISDLRICLSTREQVEDKGLTGEIWEEVN